MLKLIKKLKKKLGVSGDAAVKAVYAAAKKVAQDNINAINAYPTEVVGCEPAPLL